MFNWSEVHLYEVTSYKIHTLVTAPFAFCVITFEPIEVQTFLAPQNDRLNLRWRKIVKKWSKNDRFGRRVGGSYQ